jgi:AcrR family transcriptional regulator
MKDPKSQGRVGRPREFDMDRALDTAMRLFWRKGYEGTSLTDLTEAIGINRASLYVAFGNKEALFQKALERYRTLREPITSAALGQPTARGVVELLLHEAARELACPENPGCLAVQGALACSDAGEAIRHALCVRRAALVERLRLRFEQAQTEGDLPATAEPSDLAQYVATVMYGMAVQASGGADAEQLRRIAQIALHAWPA